MNTTTLISMINLMDRSTTKINKKYWLLKLLKTFPKYNIVELRVIADKERNKIKRIMYHNTLISKKNV